MITIKNLVKERNNNLFMGFTGVDGPTPINAVNVQINELSVEWSNMSLQFLFPASGYLTYPVVVYWKLFESLRLVIKDDEDRGRHILENMLYLSEINPYLCHYALKQGFINVIEGDYLKYKTKMKFDSILGNPPYQNANSESDAGKLYIDITKKSLELLKDDGIISFLTPETIVRDGRNKFNIKDIQGLKYINHTFDKYFNVGVKIINWMVDKNYDGDVTVINTDGEVNLRSKTQSLLDKSELLGVGIFEKLKEQKSKLFIIDQSGKKWSKTYSEGMYRVNKNVNKHKVEYTSVKPKLFEKRKLVISMSSSYKEELVYDSYEDFGELHVMIDITDYNDVEINNIKNFLFNPICVNICNKYKKLYKKGFNTMLYLFPKIDVSKEYGYEDVKLLFNLTDDEVKYLLS